MRVTFEQYEYIHDGWDINLSVEDLPINLNKVPSRLLHYLEHNCDLIITDIIAYNKECAENLLVYINEALKKDFKNLEVKFGEMDYNNFEVEIDFDSNKKAIKSYLKKYRPVYYTKEELDDIDEWNESDKVVALQYILEDAYDKASREHDTLDADIREGLEKYYDLSEESYELMGEDLKFDVFPKDLEYFEHYRDTDEGVFEYWAEAPGQLKLQLESYLKDLNESMSKLLESSKKVDKVTSHLLSGIEDWGGVTSDDFKAFTREFRSMMKEQIAKVNGYDYVQSNGHYYISGFFTVEGQPYYFSISDVRHFPSDELLIRTATDYKDYRGGSNHYVKIADNMFIDKLPKM